MYYCDNDCISHIKYIDGKRIHRQVFCAIYPTVSTVSMDLLKKHSMYIPGDSMFHENEYVVPERAMNLFISLNGGVDKYMAFEFSSVIQDDTMCFLLKDPFEEWG